MPLACVRVLIQAGVGDSAAWSLHPAAGGWACSCNRTQTGGTQAYRETVSTLCLFAAPRNPQPAATGAVCACVCMQDGGVVLPCLSMAYMFVGVLDKWDA